MAISRSQMRRQLSNRGGITNISPRQNFGLGSKLKRFVRKVIPNEVSKVAVAAAPFVAPFNPALAAGMAGIGSFDQTGSISDALKRGALTYGGGQAARYIGGAGFQGNPFQGDVLGNFTSFSSPIGTETGLGKFFEQRRVANIGKDLKEIGEVQSLGGSPVVEASEVALTGGSPIVEASEVALTGNTKETVKSNVFKKMLENPSIENIGNAAVEGAKKLGKAIFYDKDGNLDKNVLLGTIAFTASYAEAKSLANDVGVDLTEAEYDEATKAEKKAEYAANLQNFYAGKNEGGRIGFENGGIDMMALEKSVMENPEMVNEITNIEFGVAEPGEPTDQGPFIRFDKEKEEAEMLKEILRELEADGGRIGYNQGGDTETRIDLMGDLSKEDLKLYSKLRRDVFSKIFDDQEGYAQTYFEVLNPFDDKPADTRSSQVRASSFDKAMKILIPGIISTKNDPKARRDFIERFTENYNLNIPGVENQYLKNGGRIGLREGTGGKKKY
jgi:hypothetical protein